MITHSHHTVITLPLKSDGLCDKNKQVDRSGGNRNRRVPENPLFRALKDSSGRLYHHQHRPYSFKAKWFYMYCILQLCILSRVCVFSMGLTIKSFPEEH
jgi:hypothetical protein